MRTIIIGKNSNLSRVIKKNIDNVILASSANINEELNDLNFNKDESINIIFNNFQMATELENVGKPVDYINYSVMTTAIVLDYIKRNNININKIIYTSSSSVYGNNILCSELDALNPLNLHPSLKIANEKLIEKFCNDNEIDYTIARIFNMYGGDDKFSVISKIENSYLDNKILTIINNGNAVRDFIYIDDVVKIYKKLLEIKEVPIVNVGTGIGVSIKNIIDSLHNKGIYIKVKTIPRDELKISTADTIKLFSIIGKFNFQNVEEFLQKRILGNQF